MRNRFFPFLVILIVTVLSLGSVLNSNQLSDTYPIFERQGYSVCYDGRNKVPFWVREYLTKESLESNFDRKGIDFKEDKSIPSSIRSTLKDYKGTGFDRGHICPSRDSSFSEEALEETFLLSNVTPQEPRFNRGYWKKLEKHIRDLTQEYDSLEVFSGPLYLPYNDPNGKRYVKYQVIGENDVAVPTHFFKIIIAEDKVWSYILPNQEIQKDIPLESFEVTLEKVEKVSGIIFRDIEKTNRLEP